MKSKLLILMVIICIGCSKSDSETIHDLSINPPGWILGEWHEVDYWFSPEILIFREDNFCKREGAYSGYCYKWYNHYNDYNEYSSTEEQISENEYVLTLVRERAENHTYKFTRVSDTLLDFFVGGGFRGQYLHMSGK